MFFKGFHVQNHVKTLKVFQNAQIKKRCVFKEFHVQNHVKTLKTLKNAQIDKRVVFYGFSRPET